MTEIIPVRLGFSRSYILRGDSVVAVDCGIPGKGGVFASSLRNLGIAPGDVGLIVITHGHSDHVGSAFEIRELTGAPIAMHRLDGPWLEEPTMPPPPGVTRWGRLFMKLRKYIMPVEKVRAAPVDIIIGDEGASLSDYGVPGRIVWTPGHTEGSISVLLDTGDAMVGDLAMNMFPLTLRPGLPIFAHDLDAVRESWRRLIEMGAKVVHPAHGNPFPVSVLPLRSSSA